MVYGWKIIISNIINAVLLNSLSTSLTTKVLDIDRMVKGKANGYYIDEQWMIPKGGLELNADIVEDQKKRGIVETPTNMTLPLALMTLDPIQFPTRSKAKKALR